MAQIHEASEFRCTNVGWAIRTADRYYKSWQYWQQQADAGGDELIQTFAKRWKAAYNNFMKKYSFVEVQR